MYLSTSDKKKIVDVCKRNDVSYCAVFGSFARGEANETSDIDLLVRFSKPKGIEFIGVGLELEDILGRRVDLITEKSLHPLIRESVMEDLQVIYEERKSGSAAAYS